jgi:uncharacterized protein (TIGR03086 family)
MDLLEQFDRSSSWAGSKVSAAAGDLDRGTVCEQWTVRDLVNHMIDTQNYFAASARGEEPSLPNPSPPSLAGSDPAAIYEQSRQGVLDAYSDPGVVEKAGFGLGIAAIDQLVHGWDLATSTGQDASMPNDLAEAAFAMLDGRLTDDRRGDAFKPALQVPGDASAQDKLLAYSGRQP